MLILKASLSCRGLSASSKRSDASIHVGGTLSLSLVCFWPFTVYLSRSPATNLWLCYHHSFIPRRSTYQTRSFYYYTLANISLHFTVTSPLPKHWRWVIPIAGRTPAFLTHAFLRHLSDWFQTLLLTSYSTIWIIIVHFFTTLSHLRAHIVSYALPKRSHCALRCHCCPSCTVS